MKNCSACGANAIVTTRLQNIVLAIDAHFASSMRPGSIIQNRAHELIRKAIKIATTKPELLVLQGLRFENLVLRAKIERKLLLITNSNANKLRRDSKSRT